MKGEGILDATLAFMAQGGTIMFPLAGCAALLWYVVGYRACLLRRGTRLDVRALVALGREAPRGLMGDAARAAVAAAAGTGQELRRRLDAALLPQVHGVDRGARVLRALVSVSPLLGLLGTVTGMVTMFDSLGSGTGFEAGDSGIARGIAEALHATELSLVIAVPGYFVSRLLERRAAQLRSELEQLKDVLCGGGTP